MHTSQTVSRRTHFNWHITKDGIEYTAESNNGCFLNYEIISVFSWLHGRFENKSFPLSNNVKHIPKGEDDDGLGRACLYAGITPVSRASYLGPILRELGFLELVTGEAVTLWEIPKGKLPKDIINFLNNTQTL